MTISEGKKINIISLYNKGVNKKDIARIEEVSYPSIRTILSENNTEQIQEKVKEKNEIVVKKLSEIFTCENCTEQAILELIYNLRKIASDTNRELGELIEDVSFLFEKYNKYSENPVKLFDFLMDVSNNFSLILDNIEPEQFFKVVEGYYERGIYLNDTETYIKEEIIPSLDDYIERKKELGNEIIEMQKELNKITSARTLMLSKLLQQPNKQKLQKALENNNELQIFAQKLAEKAQMLISENQAFKKMLEKINKENSLLIEAFQRINLIYPEEVKKIISEIENGI